MEKVRIGIIGTGGVANSRHIKELLQCKNAKIVALCDIDLTALAKSAERTGVDTAHCYTDYRDLIADPIVDAIEICTPNYLHAEMAIAALAAGKPINLEKPIAMSYEQSQAIVSAEKDSTSTPPETFKKTCTPQANRQLPLG